MYFKAVVEFYNYDFENCSYYIKEADNKYWQYIRKVVKMKNLL
jgi:hypothetical protein